MIQPRWRPRLRDADNDMVLEAAVNGRAEVIATFNARDFYLGKAVSIRLNKCKRRKRSKYPGPQRPFRVNTRIFPERAIDERPMLVTAM